MLKKTPSIADVPMDQICEIVSFLPGIWDVLKLKQVSRDFKDTLEDRLHLYWKKQFATNCYSYLVGPEEDKRALDFLLYKYRYLKQRLVLMKGDFRKIQDEIRSGERRYANTKSYQRDTPTVQGMAYYSMELQKNITFLKERCLSVRHRIKQMHTCQDMCNNIRNELFGTGLRDSILFDLLNHVQGFNIPVVSTWWKFPTSFIGVTTTIDEDMYCGMELTFPIEYAQFSPFFRLRDTLMSEHLSSNYIGSVDADGVHVRKERPDN